MGGTYTTTYASAAPGLWLSRAIDDTASNTAYERLERSSAATVL
jgi:hypothetical protein